MLAFESVKKAISNLTLKWKFKKAIKLAMKGYSAAQIAEILRIPYRLADYAVFIAYMMKKREK